MDNPPQTEVTGDFTRSPPPLSASNSLAVPGAVPGGSPGSIPQTPEHRLDSGNGELGVDGDVDGQFGRVPCRGQREQTIIIVE